MPKCKYCNKSFQDEEMLRNHVHKIHSPEHKGEARDIAHAEPY